MRAVTLCGADAARAGAAATGVAAAEALAGACAAAAAVAGAGDVGAEAAEEDFCCCAAGLDENTPVTALLIREKTPPEASGFAAGVAAGVAAFAAAEELEGAALGAATLGPALAEAVAGNAGVWGVGLDDAAPDDGIQPLTVLHAEMAPQITRAQDNRKTADPATTLEP